MKKIEQYLEDFKRYFKGNSEGESRDSNSKRRVKQQYVLLCLGAAFILLIVAAKVFLSTSGGRGKRAEKKSEDKLELTLADESIDSETAWRQHFERKLKKQAENNEEKLSEMQKRSEQMMQDFKVVANSENAKLRDSMQRASSDLAAAKSLIEELDREKRAALTKLATQHKEIAIEENDYQTEVQYSTPKPRKSYIPEGTFFVGKLLGGISASTALGAPDNNATSVTIRLTGRGNLDPKNPLKIKDCRIMGSAYGDISSERAFVRLEKMICLINGSYVESRIAGQAFGPDGYNGIKGQIIETSSKHLKNAMLGGILSGFSQNVKDTTSTGVLSGSGLVQTKKKGAGEMIGSSLLGGASSAGEKLAEYYLRQAERMSPVLLVDNGVYVEAQITKGFFVGEIGTHRRIRAAREESKALSENRWEE